MVSMRYLRARRQEGFVSVIAGFSFLGIALGVATLIIVMAVMNGFRQELLGRILGVNGHLSVVSVEGGIKDFDAVAERIAAIPAVRSAAPLVEGQVMVSARGAASGALVRGLRPEDIRARSLVTKNIIAGGLEDFADSDSVLIGSRLAQRMGVWVQDRIRLVSPETTTTAIGTLPRLKTFRIAGVFQFGMHEYDSSFIYMPLETAQVFFRLPDRVSAVEVFLDNPDQVGELRGTIMRAAGEGFRTIDWQQANSSFFNAIQVERNVMFLILTLIILVAAFNIISGQIMLVKDKGRDIAILRTMGATRGMVMRIFFLSGASIGVVGTLIGFVLGVLFADNIEAIRQWLQGLTGTELFSAEIYFLSQLPAEIRATDVLSVVVMALGLSFLASLYPSWRAARLDPVEALRYE